MNFLYSFYKLDYKYTNSFKIIVLWDKQIYKLKLLFHFKMIYFIFHISFLKLYKKKKNEQQLLSSEIINEQNKYYIKKILN